MPDPEGENTTILEMTYLEYERTAFFELPDPVAEISTILILFAPEDDRPPRHRFFLVSLCLKVNAEMVPKIPSCHYMLLM